jgi:hypothetical protein
MGCLFISSTHGHRSSFLRDRALVVEVDSVKSAPRYLSSGVFFNDLCFCIYFSKFHFYADDLRIYLSGDRKDLDEMISALNEDLAAISRWSAENGLLLKPRKLHANVLQAIPILNSVVGMILPSLFLGTEEIPWCESATDLGVVIDGRLRFDATLHRLRLLKFLTPKQVRLKLCKAFLLPYFFYCDVVFSHLSSVDSWRLQVAWIAALDMCLIFVVMTTYPHGGMNS